LQTAALAEASLEQSGDTLADDSLHLLLGRRWPFLQVDAVGAGDVAQVDSFEA